MVVNCGVNIFIFVIRVIVIIGCIIVEFLLE